MNGLEYPFVAVEPQPPDIILALWFRLTSSCSEKRKGNNTSRFSGILWLLPLDIGKPSKEGFPIVGTLEIFLFKDAILEASIGSHMV